ncbi:hypothetical protein ACIBEJ_00685 [Nonomuraea sp. NPDC050790]|uniref:hypothetical protein n=1 Tax=Nonomuraea sp. NPDC050790 TaxID=3364371 RepID=UPI0037A88068
MEIVLPSTFDLTEALARCITIPGERVHPWTAAAGAALLVIVLVILRQLPPLCAIEIHV